MKINIFLSAAVIMAFFSSCGTGSQKTELFNGNDLSGWECFVNPESGVPASLNKRYMNQENQQTGQIQ